MNEIKNIRNFSIIAHIDHGKSTLADRMIEFTHTVEQREMREQFLDDMDLERERGITIKAKAVQMYYKDYILNLIDTPGHVDFSYEVSRSLSACEGALLIVDATQGVEAQTLANLYLALDNDLEIIPVINKIDLQGADIERVKNQLSEIGLDTQNCIEISAKTGIGIENVFEAVINFIPPPKYENEELQALIFDSHYDPYQGVIMYIRILNGSLKIGDKIFLMATEQSYNVIEVGIFKPEMDKQKELFKGNVGYCIAGIKFLKDVKVGDTITLFKNENKKAVAGFKEMKPVVFCGIYPINADNYEHLRDSLAKLQLNDSSFTYEPENSLALGFGFNCGFLGLLHMEIVQERLSREFNVGIITTTPNVLYKVKYKNGTEKIIDSAYKLDTTDKIQHIQEPFISATIIVHNDYVGNVMQLCKDYRGIYIKMEYIGVTKVIVHYKMPLAEVIVDFYDKLKSVTRGYGSFDYEIDEYKISKLVKLKILINGENVDALSMIVHIDKAYYKARSLVKKLKELIPKQQIAVPIQASLDSKIIARETVKAYRKDVLARCYGGDISRKRKLLEKQKEGKKKMKMVGKISIPQEAFRAALKI